MCGRFTIFSPASVIEEYFELTDLYPFIPSYNVAPSQNILAILENADKKRVGVGLRWGLIPSWMKEENISSQMINARLETVHEKPSFCKAFQSRRCLIVADGIYEWKKTKDSKHPIYIHPENKKPFGMAGLWEHWENNQGNVIESCTILTQEANQQISEVHNRMPVIIDPQNFSPWLDPENHDTDQLQSMLNMLDYPKMALTPVSTKVNNPRFDSPECIEEI